MKSALVYKEINFFTLDQTWISKTLSRHQGTGGVHLPFGEHVIPFTLWGEAKQNGVRQEIFDHWHVCFYHWSWTWKSANLNLTLFLYWCPEKYNDFLIFNLTFFPSPFKTRLCYSDCYTQQVLALWKNTHFSFSQNLKAEWNYSGPTEENSTEFNRLQKINSENLFAVPNYISKQVYILISSLFAVLINSCLKSLLN